MAELYPSHQFLIRQDADVYLGGLCRRKHEHEDTSQSLRYNSDGGCIVCRALQGKGWREANPERSKEIAHEWTVAHREHHADWKRTYRRKDPFRRVFESVRSRARSQARGGRLPFDLTADFLQALWEGQGGRCYWLNAPMELNSRPGYLLKATLDRLIPASGYIQGNVVWATWFANAGRNNTSADEFIALLPVLGFHSDKLSR